jgi:hypothetical protein
MCDFGFTPPDSLGSTQNGVNFHPLLAPGKLGQPPLLTTVGLPLPPAGIILPLAAVLSTSVGQQITTAVDGNINDDPTITRLQLEKLTGPCCSAYQS